MVQILIEKVVKYWTERKILKVKSKAIAKKPENETADCRNISPKMALCKYYIPRTVMYVERCIDYSWGIPSKGGCIERQIVPFV